MKPLGPGQALRAFRDDKVGAVLLCVVLAGCAPEVAAPSVEAPARASAFALPLRMVGTEPFWGGTIGAEGITLAGADRPETRFPEGERVVTGTGARWRTRAADGRALELTVVNEACSDGMSDRRYPFAVTAVLGAETLRGCAMTEAEWVRTRP